MQLIEYRQFAAKYFAPESQPSDKTMLRWLRAGTLPGRKIGNTWYVDEHAFVFNSVENELVLKVLNKSESHAPAARRHRISRRSSGKK